MDKPEIVHRLIIPREEAEKLVTQAGKVYLRDCPCRSKMQVCPREKWEVCLLFEHASEEELQQARAITADEAVAIVRMTSKRGDVHQLFYFGDGQRPYERCNCCNCCCFPLREMMEKGDYAEQLRSGYIAITNEEQCIGCEMCLDSCFFEARQMDASGLRLVDERCFGCGRCIPYCSQDAIRLEFRAERGVEIPSI